MKLVTKEEIDEFERATHIGAVKGAALGLGLSLPTAYALHRTSPRFRAFPLPLKTAAVVMLTSATTVIWAERAGMAFDRQRYSQSHQPSLDEQRQIAVKKKEEEKKSSFEQFKGFVTDNKYTVILGSWATTMGIAWTIINRDKYMTISQKIVQVRMWAQGVTIAMILATAVASQSERKAIKDHPPVDHSWMNQLKKNPEETTAVRKVTTTS